MRFFITYTLLIISVFVFSQNDIKLIKHFGKNKGGLKMYSYKPLNTDVVKKYPLVVVLHGCTQTARTAVNATDWNKLADTLQFMVIYPEQRQINNISKCFNFFIGFKAKKDKGEVASIKQMIDYTIQNNNIDTSRIFITGMSAGGGMANAMLNAYPYLFNAGALIESPSTVVEKISYDSIQPRVLIIQGEKDKVVRKKHGEKLVKQWCNKNGINTEAFKFNNNVNGNVLLSSKTYYKNNNAVIVYLFAKSVGHKLLINPGTDIKHGGKNGLHTKNIGFFSTFYIAKFWGLVH